jgi:hypothetical protein
MHTVTKVVGDNGFDAPLHLMSFVDAWLLSKLQIINLVSRHQM